jgi:hypothetical protein
MEEWEMNEGGPRKVLRLLVFVLAGGLAAAPARPGPQADPEVQKGVRSLAEGDYDAAIVALDAAARRLAADPARRQELAQAYLHLGIAYVGKGHEAAAKAKFRDALHEIHDLSLSAERFPPKVIDLFEAARAEMPAPAAARTPAPAAAPSPAPKKKGGGGKKAALIGGGVALAGGAAALAAGGGGGGGSTPATTPTSPTTLPPAQGRVEEFSGNLGSTENLSFPVSVTRTGTLDATLTWTNGAAVLAMDLYVPGAIVGTSSRTGERAANLRFAAGAQAYTLQVLHRASCSSCTTSFVLRVQYP